MMKQAIAEALENGFDYVTWTPAIAQSVRWSFDYNGAYRNTYDTAMVKAAKKFGTVSEERLGNYYGDDHDSDDRRREAAALFLRPLRLRRLGRFFTFGPAGLFGAGLFLSRLFPGRGRRGIRQLRRIAGEF